MDKLGFEADHGLEEEKRRLDAHMLWKPNERRQTRPKSLDHGLVSKKYQARAKKTGLEANLDGKNRPCIKVKAEKHSMSLSEASETRKARLVALRKRKAGEAVDETGTVQPLIKSRNFDPESRTVKKRTQDDPMLVDTVEKDVEGLAQKIIAEDEKQRAQDLDVFNIAPKRPNWDLKREMERKMAKLERRTQEAIHMLIRQRLAAQKGESDDLVGAMKAQEQQNASETLSDEDDD